jgi:hypothetical protein
MNKNPLNKGVLTENSTGIGPATRAMVDTRARELALIAGRGPSDVWQVDYERAKRELTGESDMDRQDALLDSLPEAKRWDPVPGSAGRQAPESSDPDQDEEGRSETEQLVNEGSENAARDQMLQAARAAGKMDREVPPA